MSSACSRRSTSTGCGWARPRPTTSSRASCGERFPLRPPPARAAPLRRLGVALSSRPQRRWRERKEDVMPKPRLAGIEACVFDAYGTLFDFNSAVAACRDSLGERGAALSGAWRDKQLQYTWLRALIGEHRDFWTVTGQALDYVMETMGMADAKLRERLMTAYLTLACFPEVPEMLERLKSAGMKTAILSNGSPRMLSAAVEGSKLGGLLDAVLSVEEVGVYKPHPKVYQLAVDRLGVKASAISF